MDYEKKEWVFEKQSHIIRIVNKIVNDKEMNKTEYYPQLKEKIRETRMCFSNIWIEQQKDELRRQPRQRQKKNQRQQS